MKILLIDNYDSFTFNLYHYLSSLKTKVDVVRKDKITSKEIIKKKYDRLVISPGHGNPDQAGNCINSVKTLYIKIPILGVCLGHQIIGQAFGAKIINAKNLMHGKTSKIIHSRKGLFKNIQNYFGKKVDLIMSDMAVNTTGNNTIETFKSKRKRKKKRF